MSDKESNTGYEEATEMLKATYKMANEVHNVAYKCQICGKEFEKGYKMPFGHDGLILCEGCYEKRDKKVRRRCYFCSRIVRKNSVYWIKDGGLSELVCKNCYIESNQKM